jgi:hypothetical protein
MFGRRTGNWFGSHRRNCFGVQGISADDRELMLSTDVKWTFPQPKDPMLVFS